MPRIEQVIEPENLECPCGCGRMVQIGEDRSRRLDVMAAQYRVIETVRPRYACANGCAGVAQAPAPAHLVEGGIPTEALLAQVGRGHTGGRLLGGEAAPQSRGPDRAWPHWGSWYLRRWRQSWQSWLLVRASGRCRVRSRYWRRKSSVPTCRWPPELCDRRP